MGKRNSRKSGQKKLKDSFEVVHSICESNIELIKENLSKLEDEKKLLDLEGLRNQITHYISRIYSEFALDLDERRASRLHSKDFFEEKTLPNLKITPEFMGKMNELLVNIKDDESIQKIKDFVYKHADSFVDQLKEAFLDMINARRQLQIILMHEAYAYIDNVSKEITKLLGCILKNDEKKLQHFLKILQERINENLSKVNKNQKELGNTKAKLLHSQQVNRELQEMNAKFMKKEEELEGKIARFEKKGNK